MTSVEQIPKCNAIDPFSKTHSNLLSCFTRPPIDGAESASTYIQEYSNTAVYFPTKRFAGF